MNCAEVLERLDAHLDGELSGADTDAVVRHLATCAECSATLTKRTALRNRLRNAARTVDAPPALAGRIRSGITAEATASRGRWGFLAVAAMALLAVGGYIASLRPDLAPVMRIGLEQHVHCAVLRSYGGPTETVAQLAQGLGPQFASIVPILQGRVPSGFRVVMAHRCDYNGRQYVHVVARQQNELISLLITLRIGGEAFGNDLRAVAWEAGTPVYTSATSHFSIAGFETNRYLVFLVSDLKQGTNAAVIESMTPALKSALS